MTKVSFYRIIIGVLVVCGAFNTYLNFSNFSEIRDDQTALSQQQEKECRNMNELARASNLARLSFWRYLEKSAQHTRELVASDPSSPGNAVRLLAAEENEKLADSVVWSPRTNCYLALHMEGYKTPPPFKLSKANLTKVPE